MRRRKSVVLPRGVEVKLEYAFLGLLAVYMVPMVVLVSTIWTFGSEEAGRTAAAAMWTGIAVIIIAFLGVKRGLRPRDWHRWNEWEVVATFGALFTLSVLVLMLV